MMLRMLKVMYYRQVLKQCLIENNQLGIRFCNIKIRQQLFKL